MASEAVEIQAPHAATAPAAGKVRLTSGGAFVIDHALAERTIGWTPQVKMREGIGRLLRWREEAETRATKAKARA